MSTNETLNVLQTCFIRSVYKFGAGVESDRSLQSNLNLLLSFTSSLKSTPESLDLKTISIKMAYFGHRSDSVDSTTLVERKRLLLFISDVLSDA